MGEEAENFPSDGAAQQDAGDPAGAPGQAAGSPAVVASVTLEAPVPEVAALQDKITELQEQLDSSSRFADKREQQIVQLHTELERFKKGEMENKLRAVLMNLIEMYDDLQDIIANGGFEDGSPMRRSLAAFESGLIETLRRNGVEPYQADGDVYDPQQQRPLQVLTTDDPEKDKRIAKRVRVGFRLGDLNIRQELVNVYRLAQ